MPLQHKDTLADTMVIIDTHVSAVMFALLSSDAFSCGRMLQLRAA